MPYANINVITDMILIHSLPNGEVFDMTMALVTNDTCVPATLYPFEKLRDKRSWIECLFGNVELFVGDKKGQVI